MLQPDRQGKLGDSLLYLDPQGAEGAEPVRVRGHFSKAIAFMVGGGNYVEASCVHEWAQSRGLDVLYSSTDIVSPESFVEELAYLGASHR